MITIADLQTSLLDLLHEIEGSEVKVIIGEAFSITDQLAYPQVQKVLESI